MIDARIGVAVRAPASDALHAALSRLAERCSVVALSDGGPFDAVVRTSPAGREYAERTVLWVEDVADVPDEPHAVALLAAPAVARALRGTVDLPVVALGPAAVHRRARPIMPFTRARIRRARGLVGPAVARHLGGTWTWDGTVLEPEAGPTAAGLAAVVVADDDASAVLGAAWSAPVVAPRDVAERTGLPVAASDDPEAEVERLLADETAAAVLARSCRRAFELEHDPDAAVVHLSDILVLRPGRPWETGYAAPLDRLGTPPDARIRDRAHAAIHVLRSR
ncbi:hypothetical protein J1G42_10345 [Cellulomonas sp. zg-ZUI222]|uniref:hypothetical protein n=1 Tax=Cellulomonas TaxID=1707 RepID=UPI001A948809|nr:MULTISPECIES: hypothetical protein [Cellulomonas]MBO0899863.1 hypothetical protein [Cellulomonas sp. zg-ZUI22]MBO0921223.1 hypothetical protein [Cellulomonas wangleii]